MKRCSKCKRIQPLSAFQRSKNEKDRHQFWCKSCMKASEIKRRLRNKKKFGSLYDVWKGIKDRCFNLKNKGFKYYGGRGITVCQEWKGSFQVFYQWAKDKHKKGLQIDRRNNDGNYCPGNCRFATGTENIRNSSATKLSIQDVKEIRSLLDKKKLSQKKIGAIFGINQSMVSHIKVKMSWAEV